MDAKFTTAEMNCQGFSPYFFHRTSQQEPMFCGPRQKHLHILRRRPIKSPHLHRASFWDFWECATRGSLFLYFFFCLRCEGVCWKFTGGGGVPILCSLCHYLVRSGFGVAVASEKMFGNWVFFVCCDEFYCCWRRSSLILHNALSGCFHQWPCAHRWCDECIIKVINYAPKTFQK